MGPLTSVRELLLPANGNALDAAVARYRIQPERVISVIWLPGGYAGIGDGEPKYRILYRS